MIVQELVNRLRVVIDRRSVSAADRAQKRMQRSAERTRAAFSRLAGGLAAAFAGQALVGQIRQFVDETDKIAKTAAKIGVATDALQELQFAAQLTGVPTNALNMGLQRFTRRAAEAAKGGGSAKDAFHQLGISLRDANGDLKASESLMEEVADGIASIQDPSEQVRLAFKFFDSEGVALVNTLRGGSAALRDMREQARATGGVLSTSTLQQSEAAADAMLRFDFVLRGLKAQFAAGILPQLTNAIDKIGELVAKTRIVKVAFGVLGAIAGALAAKMLLPFLPAILAVGALIAIVDELIALFRGERTVIGDFFSDLLGEDRWNEIVDGWRVGGAALGAAIFEMLHGVEGSTEEFWAVWRDGWSALWEHFLFGWKTVLDPVATWIADVYRKIQSLRGTLADLGSFVGLSDSTTGAIRGGPGRPPPLPTAPASAAGSATTVNSGGNTINVAAPAGSSPRRVAEEVRRVLDDRERRALRGAGG